jgi:phosphatidate cytidylyltransferase
MAWDRPDDDKTAGDKTEGVRIIGAEEAAEALERGDVAPRRGEGELKYGDRPAPPPEDARPAVRFPLPAAADPEAPEALRPRVVPSPPPAAPSMPHWTDPPTGEVPKIIPEGVEGGSDDLEAWSSFATSGPRWRDQAGDWEDADFDAADLGHDEGTRVGALDDRERPAPDDFFGVHAEEDLVTIDEVPPRPVATPPVPRPRPRRGPGASVPNSGRDMPMAIATGMGMFVLALILFKIGPAAVLALVAAVIVLAAAELFAALQRGGYQPATLLGLVASGGLVLSAYWKGEAALPLVLGLTVLFTFLWYLLGVTRSSPTMNAGVTLLAVLQIGLLGSFGALILTLPHGRGVLFGVILATATNDIGALLIGQQVGRAPVAPSVSPNKTVEGVVGGAITSVILTILVLKVFNVDPWTTGSAAALALVVAVAAPLGDLAESMIKRDLGIKDMGTVLPGHGGFLDRFDGLLFALPVVYYLCRLLNIG